MDQKNIQWPENVGKYRQTKGKNVYRDITMGFVTIANSSCVEVKAKGSACPSLAISRHIKIVLAVGVLEIELTYKSKTHYNVSI